MDVRRASMYKLADLEQEADELAALETLDNGKVRFVIRAQPISP